jgi:hypothetical protein
MIEAVGHEHLPSYFATINAALKPGGKAVIQVSHRGHTHGCKRQPPSCLSGGVAWLHFFACALLMFRATRRVCAIAIVTPPAGPICYTWRPGYSLCCGRACAIILDMHHHVNATISLLRRLRRSLPSRMSATSHTAAAVTSSGSTSSQVATCPAWVPWWRRHAAHRWACTNVCAAHGGNDSHRDPTAGAPRLVVCGDNSI